MRDAVIAELADYGGTDLLCYRAEAPEALIAAPGRRLGPADRLGRHRLARALDRSPMA